MVVGDTAGSDVGAAKFALGETPNLAARLQGMAKADEIVASASTYRLVGSRFRCRGSQQCLLSDRDQFERAAQFAASDTPAQKLVKMEALLKLTRT